MHYYCREGHVLCCEEKLPYEPIVHLPENGDIIYLLRRPVLQGRETFFVSQCDLLRVKESIEILRHCGGGEEHLPAELSAAIAGGRVRAVNMEHPRWQELLSSEFPICFPCVRKLRLHLLALGDVGSTLLLGLRLMGGDVLSFIGICDLREGVARRWEFEMNQIQLPGQYDAFPPVDVVDVDHIFDCDVFLFCASRFVPDTAVKTGDVRMAQYELNRELVEAYGRMARQKQFKGLFCVVSDPVDPLCRAALLESNRNEAGELDGMGLFPHQVRGFGLGVMNARAVYYAQKDPRFADFLTDGRCFGPHGEDLVVANSISNYNNQLSLELTDKTAHANLEMREMGFKPYVAPAISSGALSILQCLRGKWHCSSVYLDGIFMGVQNRISPSGPEIERLALPEELIERLRETVERLKAIP